MRIGEQEIKEKLRWLSRQNKDIQAEVFDQAFGEQGLQVREALAMAAKTILQKMQRDKRKALDREVAVEELAETHKLRIKALYKDRKGRKKSKLYKRVKLRIKLIENLRQEGLGWRMDALYLEKYADLKISYQQLRRLYLQIKEKEEETNNE